MENSQYLRALKYCEQDIINDLIVEDIYPELLSCELFTFDHKEIIESEVTSRAKVSKLLDIIRGQNENLFEKFRDALRRTNEELAEYLEVEINQKDFSRSRRYSNTEFGEILIIGEVPNRSGDYVPRLDFEKRILNYLKSSNKMPLLVHGVAGCGKSTIISNVLYSGDLFPNRFLKCCWLPIGDINENEIVSKLAILQKKLNPKEKYENYICNIPEILIENIKQGLKDTTTLLILDDIWKPEIMKYFTFLNVSYIVTSRQSHLFYDKKSVHMLEIPNKFNKKECQKLMSYYNIPKDIAPQVEERSHQNPMLLSIICKLINSNKDYVRLIDNVNFFHNITEIMDKYLKILDTDTRNYFEMLVILQFNDILSVELLSIIWRVPITKALKLVDTLCENNFLYKKWSQEHDCNMYGVHNMHLEHLINQYSEKKKELSSFFVSFHKSKYENWLKVNYRDPFFIKFYGRTLYNWKKYRELEDLYTNFSFLSAKIVLCGISDLLIDFEKYKFPGKTDKWLEFEKYFLKHHHKFLKLPDNKDMILTIGKVFVLLVQLGLYELKDCSIYGLANESRKLCKRNDFWNWINPQHSMKVWEVSNIEDIELFDINQYGILSSSKYGKVCFYEFKSGKCLFTYQFSEANIILLKFINGLEFILIDSEGKFWKIDLLKFLQKENISKHDEYDDDNDFQCESQNSSVEIDFSEFFNQFERLSIGNRISKSENEELKNDKLFNSKPLRACSFSNEIAILNIGEKSTYVGLYDLFGKLKSDFAVDFEIKKIMYSQDGIDFYALKEFNGEIALVDEFGNTNRIFSLKDQMIIDFVVINFDLLVAVKNSVYNFSNSEYVFTINTGANIMKISMSTDNELLALCLTDNTIQVWDYSNKEIMYTLNDTQFSDLYFQNNSNYLITIGQTNIAKWEISSLKLSNINISNNQSVSLTRYRKHFTMYNYSPSSFVLVLQSTKNNLEFISITNDNINDNVKMTVVHLCPENRPVAVFHSDNNFAYLGYVDRTVKIFDLINFKEVLELKTSVNIKKLFTFEIVKSDIIGLAVVCKSTNEIIIFHLRNNEYFKSNCKSEFPQLVNDWFMFKNSLGSVTLAAIINNSTVCLLYSLNDGKFIKEESFDFNQTIMNIDISENFQYISCIGTKGQVKIWKRSTYDSQCIQLTENVLRRCKFRPKICTDNWNILAVIDDNAELHLIYFNDKSYNVNKIVEDLPAKAMQLPHVLQWSSNSEYLLIADYDIRKWKIPSEPRTKENVKLPLTKLQTYFGGIHCVEMDLNFICTVDQQGYLYVLKKIVE